MDIKPVVLIIEDDKAISKFVKVSLEAQGYKCIDTKSGKTGVSLVYSTSPDVIILDLGLPDIDGIEVISQIRDITKAKIIVVSARSHDRDKVEALDMGADDYLTKPFSLSELLARTRVALRHIKQESSHVSESVSSNFNVKDLYVDFDKRKVCVNEKDIHLTPIEYKILELMTKYAGRVLTHKFIINEIWGSHSDGETQSLRVFMASLRRKIEKDPAQPEYIITEVGVGYRLTDE